MDDIVPGGQQVYVAADGQLGFTVAHSEAIPVGAFVVPFLYTPQETEFTVGNLNFNSEGFAACPDASGPGVYQIYSAGVDGFVRTDCIGINIATSSWSGSPAWQYT